MARKTPTLIEHMQQLRAGWNMTTNSRMRRERPVRRSGSSADYRFRNQSELFFSAELARDLEENEPLLAQGVRRFISNLKPGLMYPDPMTGNEEVNGRILELWGTWSTDKNRCHSAGECDWRSLTNRVVSRSIIDGDIFGVPITDSEVDGYLSIQIHEFERCREPTWGKKKRGVCGVARDELGRPSTYWFTKEPIGSQAAVKVGDLYEQPARDELGDQIVCHVYNPRRFYQSRGITALVPCYDHINMRDDIDFATLVKHQMQACVSMIETVDPVLWETFRQSSVQNEQLATEYMADASAVEQFTMRPGGRIRALPGVNITGFSPNIPAPAYFEHVKLLVRYMALSLDLPLIVFLLDASDTTFSSYRHVLEQARQTFSELLNTYANCWHRPIYNILVREWAYEDPLLKAFVKQNGLEALRRHNWHPPAYEYIEPVKDLTADTLDLGGGLTSHRRYAGSRHSCEWSTLYREIVDDRFVAIQYAIEQASKLNGQATWRDLLPLPDVRSLSATGILTDSAPDKPATTPAG